jgi:hypothetical protein
MDRARSLIDNYYDTIQTSLNNGLAKVRTRREEAKKEAEEAEEEMLRAQVPVIEKRNRDIKKRDQLDTIFLSGINQLQAKFAATADEIRTISKEMENVRAIHQECSDELKFVLDSLKDNVLGDDAEYCEAWKKMYEIHLDKLARERASEEDFEKAIEKLEELMIEQKKSIEAIHQISADKLKEEKAEAAKRMLALEEAQNEMNRVYPGPLQQTGQVSRASEDDKKIIDEAETNANNVEEICTATAHHPDPSVKVLSVAVIPKPRTSAESSTIASQTSAFTSIPLSTSYVGENDVGMIFDPTISSRSTEMGMPPTNPKRTEPPTDFTSIPASSNNTKSVVKPDSLPPIVSSQPVVPNSNTATIPFRLDPWPPKVSSQPVAPNSKIAATSSKPDSWPPIVRSQPVVPETKKVRKRIFKPVSVNPSAMTAQPKIPQAAAAISKEVANVLSKPDPVLPGVLHSQSTNPCQFIGKHPFLRVSDSSKEANDDSNDIATVPSPQIPASPNLITTNEAFKNYSNIATTPIQQVSALPKSTPNRSGPFKFWELPLSVPRLLNYNKRGFKFNTTECVHYPRWIAPSNGGYCEGILDNVLNHSTVQRPYLFQCTGCGTNVCSDCFNALFHRGLVLKTNARDTVDKNKLSLKANVSLEREEVERTGDQVDHTIITFLNKVKDELKPSPTECRHLVKWNKLDDGGTCVVSACYRKHKGRFMLFLVQCSGCGIKACTKGRKALRDQQATLSPDKSGKKKTDLDQDNQPILPQLREGVEADSTSSTAVADAKKVQPAFQWTTDSSVQTHGRNIFPADQTRDQSSKLETESKNSVLSQMRHPIDRNAKKEDNNVDKKKTKVTKLDKAPSPKSRHTPQAQGKLTSSPEAQSNPRPAASESHEITPIVARQNPVTELAASIRTPTNSKQEIGRGILSSSQSPIDDWESAHSAEEIEAALTLLQIYHTPPKEPSSIPSSSVHSSPSVESSFHTPKSQHSAATGSTISTLSSVSSSSPPMMNPFTVSPFNSPSSINPPVKHVVNKEKALVSKAPETVREKSETSNSKPTTITSKGTMLKGKEKKVVLYGVDPMQYNIELLNSRLHQSTARPDGPLMVEGLEGNENGAVDELSDLDEILTGSAFVREGYWQGYG